MRILNGCDTQIHDELIQINYIQAKKKKKKSIIFFFFFFTHLSHLIKTMINEGFFFHHNYLVFREECGISKIKSMRAQLLHVYHDVVDCE